MCVSVGKRVKIFPLKIEDVYEMQNWGKHENPLFEDYNFPQLTQEEANEWFKIKTSKRNKKCFSIRNEEGKVIGYLTIKNISKIWKRSTLGIVFDPNYINKEYGTETIKVFLKYYFDELKMKILRLYVAKFNKRAIRCYEKCGFKKVREYIRKFDNQNIKIFEDDSFKDIREDFVRKRGYTYSIFYEMRITKDNYKKVFN